MTTSSRKKGILPVRLGLEPDNKTALKELKMDPDLADKMTDEEPVSYTHLTMPTICSV